VRVVLRLIALFAAASAAMTLLFIADVVAAGDMGALIQSGLLGTVTIFGWLLAVIAGPLTAVQLWRFKEIGRRAGIVLCGFGVAYYVAGFFLLRGPGASLAHISLSLLIFALPLGVLLSRRAKEICRPAPPVAIPTPAAADTA
jgi:hypothetical protein